MKITCQSCQSKYTVSDEKVQGKTVKIKCRKCGATILVNSGGVTTSGAGLADPMSVVTGGPASDGGVTYLVNVADGDQRSLTLAEIVAAYNSSVITADTYVWADGMADWSPVSQVEAIVSALNAPASPSAPPPAAASAPPPAATPAPSAAEPEHRAAARRDPARRGAQDLFSARGPEEMAVATSAPSYSNGSAHAAPARPPAAALPGQREENSMLFSLSALTAKVGSSASPSSAPAALSARPVTTARDREDSGIIDLKALAAAAQATQSSAQQPSTSSFLPDTGLFPLGAPVTSSPIAAPPVVSSAETPQTKSKTPLFIGVGAVVAVGAIVGAFLFMKGGPPPPAPVAAAAETASDTPTASAPVAATVAPTASAVASAAPTASASATAAAVVAKGGRGGGAPRGGGAAAPKGGGAAAPAGGGAAAPAAPATPKKGGCGCAAGDLMCAMKCSAH
jgi:predicted Zn finger-like uncharacterized protein